MKIKPMSPDKLKLVYEISKEYVEDNYPELKGYFDSIWAAAFSGTDENKRMLAAEEMGGLGFLGEDALPLMVNVLLPFISGVISSITATEIIRRMNSTPKETVKVVEKEAEQVRIEMRINKQMLSDVLPYVLSVFSKVQQETSKVQHLEDLLGEELRHIFKQVKSDRELNDLLVHIQNAHPNFTSHGPDHSESVIANIEKLLPRYLWEHLTPLEILVLLCAAWIHDVGMADFEGKLAECKNEEDRKSLSKNLRDNHSQRSEKYVTNPNNYRRLLFEPPIAEIVGVISKSHVNEYHLEKLPSNWGPLHGYKKYGKVRVRLLAALLRLADACDLGHHRVKEVLITVYNIPNKYVDSIPHVEGALLITGVVIKSRSIVVQAAPRDKEQAAWVKFLADMLREDFLSVKPILEDKKNNGVAIPYKEVRLELLEAEQ